MRPFFHIYLISFQNFTIFSCQNPTLNLFDMNPRGYNKSLGDARALLPVLTDFFHKHPFINPEVFLGDAAFDAIAIYKSLFENFRFKKYFIPLHTKLSM